MDSNFWPIYKTFQELGVPDPAARGAIASLMGESYRGLYTTPPGYNDGGNAGGFAQWNGPRFAQLKQYAAKQGLPWTDINAQTGFLKQELQGPYNHVLQQLKTPGLAPEQATGIWTGSYEKPTVDNTKARLANIPYVNNMLAGGVQPASAPPEEPGVDVKNALVQAGYPQGITRNAFNSSALDARGVPQGVQSINITPQGRIGVSFNSPALGGAMDKLGGEFQISQVQGPPPPPSDWKAPTGTQPSSPGPSIASSAPQPDNSLLRDPSQAQGSDPHPWWGWYGKNFPNGITGLRGILTNPSWTPTGLMGLAEGYGTKGPQEVWNGKSYTPLNSLQPAAYTPNMAPSQAPQIAPTPQTPPSPDLTTVPSYGAQTARAEQGDYQIPYGQQTQRAEQGDYSPPYGQQTARAEQALPPPEDFGRQTARAEAQPQTQTAGNANAKWWLPPIAAQLGLGQFLENLGEPGTEAQPGAKPQEEVGGKTQAATPSVSQLPTLDETLNALPEGEGPGANAPALQEDMAKVQAGREALAQEQEKERRQTQSYGQMLQEQSKALEALPQAQQDWWRGQGPGAMQAFAQGFTPSNTKTEAAAFSDQGTMQSFFDKQHMGYGTPLPGWMVNLANNASAGLGGIAYNVANKLGGETKPSFGSLQEGYSREYPLLSTMENITEPAIPMLMGSSVLASGVKAGADSLGMNSLGNFITGHSGELMNGASGWATRLASNIGRAVAIDAPVQTAMQATLDQNTSPSSIIDNLKQNALLNAGWAGVTNLVNSPLVTKLRRAEGTGTPALASQDARLLAAGVPEEALPPAALVSRSKAASDALRSSPELAAEHGKSVENLIKEWGGIPSSEPLTPAAVQGQKAKLGQLFDKVNSALDANPQTQTHMFNAAHDAMNYISQNVPSELQSKLEDNVYTMLRSMNTSPKISGVVENATNSLSNLAREAGRSSNLAHHAAAIQDILQQGMDTAVRQIDPALADANVAGRGQYRLLQSVENGVRSSGVFDPYAIRGSIQGHAGGQPSPTLASGAPNRPGVINELLEQQLPIGRTGMPVTQELPQENILNNALRGGRGTGPVGKTVNDTVEFLAKSGGLRNIVSTGLGIAGGGWYGGVPGMALAAGLGAAGMSADYATNRALGDIVRQKGFRDLIKGNITQDAMDLLANSSVAEKARMAHALPAVLANQLERGNQKPDQVRGLGPELSSRAGSIYNSILGK